MVDHAIVLLFFTIKSIGSGSPKLIYSVLSQVNGEKNYTNLNNSSILDACDFRDTICESNDTAVCAMRIISDEEDFKTFNNSCYLFFNNMCENDGNEYYIIQGGSCDSYLNSKRADFRRKSNESDTENVNSTKKLPAIFARTSSKENLEEEIANEAETSPPTDEAETSPPTDYEESSAEENTAFDGHRCPFSCPDVYQPICIVVNMVAGGRHLKHLSFINHCYGDIYYCMHSQQFDPPGDFYQDVNVSPLGWSYCGANRYVMFNRFSETVSSMGHYGWLAGNQKFSHIMEPHERMPGFG